MAGVKKAIRKKRITFFSIPILILLLSCGDWVMPESLIGTWSSTQKVTVRYNVKISTFQFVSDTVEITMSINDEGKVNGSVGEAKFDNCSVSQNRGEIGKKLNIATDYVIKGKLNGSIFSQDTLKEKGISIPFNMENNNIKGTIFQKQGMMDIFPMVNIQLTKK